MTFMPLLASVVVSTYAWLVLLGDQGLVNTVLRSTGIIHAPLRFVYNFTGVVIGLTHAVLPYAVLAIMAALLIWALAPVFRALLQAMSNVPFIGAYVAGRALAGATMAASVMGDDAKAAIEKEQHLGVPIVGRQRPAMAEDDGLACAPILVENLRAVLRGDRRHAILLTLICST